MNDRPRTDGMDISAFFGVLRRRALIIVLAVIAGAVVAYLVSSAQDKKYTATAKLLLKGQAAQQSGGTPDFSPTVPGTAPDRESLVTRGAVLDITRRRLSRPLGSAEAAQVTKDLKAVSGQDSSVVDLTATAPSARAAALGANTLAAANIDYRKAQTLRGIARARKATQQELDKLGSPTTQNAGNVSQLQTTLSNLRQAAATTDGFAEVVEAATPPSSASSPKPTRNALIGAFAGLLLGLALASIVEQLDRRVRHSKELGDVFGLPVLAHVPKSRALAEEDGRALEKLPTQEAEAFQLLRANLRYLNTEKELRSVVVTSTGVGDGKSTVALNLAKADASVAAPWRAR
jgi:succinoglycan biosynthesis transport protein ExoP